MSKTVVISLGKGSLRQGLPHIATRLWTAQRPQVQQTIGSLPPAPELADIYRVWQSTYRALSDRLVLNMRMQDAADELEIDAVGVTQVSQQSFDELSCQLKQAINDWLSSDGLRSVERQLRSQLNPTDNVRVIFETNDDVLLRLPWQCWTFFQDYPNAEMALSQLDYCQRETASARRYKKQVRILAVVGDSRGIDVEPERQVLQALPDAEVTFLVGPSRHIFDRYLWDKRGWDILFIAGHSQTEGERGRLYINNAPVHNSLTIEQLEEGLRHAIAHGLQLAIFNSCDGIGIAQSIGGLQIPQIIVMREPVPNRVAQIFLQHFLTAFATEKLPLYLAIRQSRGQLQGLENEFPGASWLPVLCQNPAVEPTAWFQLGGVAACPYKGLATFEEADAHMFFGREKVVEALLKAVTQQPFVAVMGPSGSGKSSVVFAGLLPRLRQGHSFLDHSFPDHSFPGREEEWQIVTCRPGADPFGSLAEALFSSWTDIEKATESDAEATGADDTESRLKVDSRLKILELAVRFQQNDQALCEAISAHSRGRSLLVLDQFEELYTLCRAEDREPFLNLLLNAVQSAPAFTLLLAMRADFYGEALSNRRLSDALQAGSYNLGPMNSAELTDAITRPAAKLRVTLEPGLTEQLIQSTAAQSGHLPLLEFALTELWAQQEKGRLTHAAYRAIGGVEEAIANHADAVYAGLSADEQRRVQRIFMQLVEFNTTTNPATHATRRMASRDDVGDDNWGLVAKLASARLVVTNRNSLTEKESVEIVHEALIYSWGRLVYWLQADGVFRRWQEELRQIRKRWEKNGRDDSDLLRGKSLATATDWYESRLADLSSKDRQFVEDSLSAQQGIEKREKRRRWLAFGALWMGLLVTSSLMAVAWYGSQRAKLNEVRAIAASSDALFASNQRLDSLVAALQAAQKLSSLRLLGRQTEQETQSAVETALRQVVSTVDEKNRLTAHKAGTTAVAFSPDGQMIASASDDKSVMLWNPDGSLLHSLEDHSAAIWGLAVSPDGQMIASASDDKTVKLWRKDGTLVMTLTGHAAAVNAVAFSPDGQLIAAASQEGAVRIWQRSGELVQQWTAHEEIKEEAEEGTREGIQIDAIAFSPDGQSLATGGDDALIKLWTLSGTLRTTLTGHTKAVQDVAFSPDGDTLASASSDRSVRLWNLQDNSQRTLYEHNNTVYAIAFSPDGEHIASASNDKTLKLWRRDGMVVSHFRGHTNGVTDVAFSADGRAIASASFDKTVRLWQWDNPVLTTFQKHEGMVWDVAFSPDGQLIASSSQDNSVKLWNSDATLSPALELGCNAVSCFGPEFERPY
ncbi:MAG: CHAT domain-containing protein [Phormidesmis sp.]